MEFSSLPCSPHRVRWWKRISWERNYPHTTSSTSSIRTSKTSPSTTTVINRRVVVSFSTFRFSVDGTIWKWGSQGTDGRRAAAGAAAVGSWWCLLPLGGMWPVERTSRRSFSGWAQHMKPSLPTPPSTRRPLSASVVESTSSPTTTTTIPTPPLLVLPSISEACRWHFTFHALQSYGRVDGLLQEEENSAHGVEEEETVETSFLKERKRKTREHAGFSGGPSASSSPPPRRMVLAFQWRCGTHPEEVQRGEGSAGGARIFPVASLTIPSWTPAWTITARSTSSSLSSLMARRALLFHLLLVRGMEREPIRGAVEVREERNKHPKHHIEGPQRGHSIEKNRSSAFWQGSNTSAASFSSFGKRGGGAVPELVFTLSLSSDTTWCRLYHTTHRALCAHLRTHWEEESFRCSGSDAFLGCSSSFFSSSSTATDLLSDGRLEKRRRREERGEVEEVKTWTSSCTQKPVLLKHTRYSSPEERFSDRRIKPKRMENDEEDEEVEEEVWTVVFLYSTSRTGRAQWYAFHRKRKGAATAVEEENEEEEEQGWKRSSSSFSTIRTTSTMLASIPYLPLQLSSSSSSSSSSRVGFHKSSPSLLRPTEGGVLGRLLLPFRPGAASTRSLPISSSLLNTTITRRTTRRVSHEDGGEKSQHSSPSFGVPLFPEEWTMEEAERYQAGRGFFQEPVLPSLSVASSSSLSVSPHVSPIPRVHNKKEEEPSRDALRTFSSPEEWYIASSSVEREETTMRSSSSSSSLWWWESITDGAWAMEWLQRIMERGKKTTTTSGEVKQEESEEEERTCDTWERAWKLLRVLDEVLCFGELQHLRHSPHQSNTSHPHTTTSSSSSSSVMTTTKQNAASWKENTTENTKVAHDENAARGASSSPRASSPLLVPPTSYCCSLPLQFYGWCCVKRSSISGGRHALYASLLPMKQEEEVCSHGNCHPSSPSHPMDTQRNVPSDEDTTKEVLSTSTTDFFSTAIYHRAQLRRNALVKAFRGEEGEVKSTKGPLSSRASSLRGGHPTPKRQPPKGGGPSAAMRETSFSFSVMLSRWIRSSGDEFCALPPLLLYRSERAARRVRGHGALWWSSLASPHELSETFSSSPLRPRPPPPDSFSINKMETISPQHLPDPQVEHDLSFPRPPPPFQEEEVTLRQKRRLTMQKKTNEGRDAVPDVGSFSSLEKDASVPSVVSSSVPMSVTSSLLGSSAHDAKAVVHPVERESLPHPNGGRITSPLPDRGRSGIDFQDSIFDPYWVQLFRIYASILVESVAIPAAIEAAAIRKKAQRHPHRWQTSSSSPRTNHKEEDGSEKKRNDTSTPTRAISSSSSSSTSTSIGKETTKEETSLSRRERKGEENDDKEDEEVIMRDTDVALIKDALYSATGVLLVLHRIISCISTPIPTATLSSSASPSSRRPLRSSAMRTRVRPLLELQALFSGGNGIHYPFFSSFSFHKSKEEDDTAPYPRTPLITPTEYSSMNTMCASWSIYGRPRVLEGRDGGLMLQTWKALQQKNNTRHVDRDTAKKGKQSWKTTSPHTYSFSSSSLPPFQEMAALWREVVRTDCLFLLSIGHASEKAEDLPRWVEKAARCRVWKREGTTRWPSTSTTRSSSFLSSPKWNTLEGGDYEEEEEVRWGTKSVKQVCQLFSDVQQHVFLLERLQNMKSGGGGAKHRTGAMFSSFRGNLQGWPSMVPHANARGPSLSHPPPPPPSSTSQDSAVEDVPEFVQFLSTYVSPGVVHTLLSRAKDALRVSMKFFLAWCEPSLFVNIPPPPPPPCSSSFLFLEARREDPPQDVSIYMEATRSHTSIDHHHHNDALAPEKEMQPPQDILQGKRLRDKEEPPKDPKRRTMEEEEGTVATAVGASFREKGSLLSILQEEIRQLISTSMPLESYPSSLSSSFSSSAISLSNAGSVAISSPSVVEPPRLPSYWLESMDVSLLCGALHLWTPSLSCCEALLAKTWIQKKEKDKEKENKMEHTLGKERGTEASSLSPTAMEQEGQGMVMVTACEEMSSFSHSNTMDIQERGVPQKGETATIRKEAKQGEENKKRIEEEKEGPLAVQAIHRLLHSMRFRTHLVQSIEEASKAFWIRLFHSKMSHPLETTPHAGWLHVSPNGTSTPKGFDGSTSSPSKSSSPLTSSLATTLSWWLSCWHRFLTERVDACRGLLPPAVAVHLAMVGALKSGVQWECIQPHSSSTDETTPSSSEEEIHHKKGPKDIPLGETDQKMDTVPHTKVEDVSASGFSTCLPWPALLLSQYTRGTPSSSGPPPLLSQTALLVLEEVFSLYFRYDTPLPSLSFRTFLSYWSGLLWQYPLLSQTLFTHTVAYWWTCMEVAPVTLFTTTTTARMTKKETNPKSEKEQAEKKENEKERLDIHPMEEDRGTLPSPPPISQLRLQAWAWRRKMKQRQANEQQKKPFRISQKSMVASQSSPSSPISSLLSTSLETSREGPSSFCFSHRCGQDLPSPTPGDLRYEWEERLLEWVSLLYQQATVASTSAPAWENNYTPIEEPVEDGVQEKGMSTTTTTTISLRPCCIPTSVRVSGKWEWEALIGSSHVEERTEDFNMEAILVDTDYHSRTNCTSHHRLYPSTAPSPSPPLLCTSFGSRRSGTLSGVSCGFLGSLPIALRHRLQEMLWRHKGGFSRVGRSSRISSTPIPKKKEEEERTTMDMSMQEKEDLSVVDPVGSTLALISSTSLSSTLTQQKEYERGSGGEAATQGAPTQSTITTAALAIPPRVSSELFFSPASSLWHSIQWRTISTALSVAPPCVGSSFSSSSWFSSSSPLESCGRVFFSLFQEAMRWEKEWRETVRQMEIAKEYTTMIRPWYGTRMEVERESGFHEKDAPSDGKSLLQEKYTTEVEGPAKGTTSFPIPPFPLAPETLSVLRFDPVNIIPSSPRLETSETSPSSPTIPIHASNSTEISSTAHEEKQDLPSSSFSMNSFSDASGDFHRIAPRQYRQALFIQRVREVRFLFDTYPWEATSAIPQNMEPIREAMKHTTSTPSSSFRTTRLRPWRCPYCLFWNAGHVHPHENDVATLLSPPHHRPPLDALESEEEGRRQNDGACCCTRCGSERGGWLWCRTCAQLTPLPRTFVEWQAEALTQLLCLREAVLDLTANVEPHLVEEEGLDESHRQGERKVDLESARTTAFTMDVVKGCTISCWCCEAVLCRIQPTTTPPPVSSFSSSFAMKTLHDPVDQNENPRSEAAATTLNRHPARGMENRYEGDPYPRKVTSMEIQKRTWWSSTASAPFSLDASLEEEQQRPLAHSFSNDFFGRSTLEATPRFHGEGVADEKQEHEVYRSFFSTSLSTVGDGVYLSINTAQVARLWWWKSWVCETCHTIHYPFPFSLVKEEGEERNHLGMDGWKRGLLFPGLHGNAKEVGARLSACSCPSLPSCHCTHCSALPTLPQDGVLIFHHPAPSPPRVVSSLSRENSSSSTTTTTSLHPTQAIESTPHGKEATRGCTSLLMTVPFEAIRLPSGTSRKPSWGAGASERRNALVFSSSFSSFEHEQGEEEEGEIQTLALDSISNKRSLSPGTTSSTVDTGARRPHARSSVVDRPSWKCTVCGMCPPGLIEDEKHRSHRPKKGYPSSTSTSSSEVSLWNPSKRPFCVFCGALQLQWCRPPWCPSPLPSSLVSGGSGNGSSMVVPTRVGTLWVCVECTSTHPWYTAECSCCGTTLLDTLIRRRWWQQKRGDWGEGVGTTCSPPSSLPTKEVPPHPGTSSGSLSSFGHSVSGVCTSCGTSLHILQRRCWQCGVPHPPLLLTNLSTSPHPLPLLSSSSTATNTSSWERTWRLFPSPLRSGSEGSTMGEGPGVYEGPSPPPMSLGYGIVFTKEKEPFDRMDSFSPLSSRHRETNKEDSTSEKDTTEKNEKRLPSCTRLVFPPLPLPCVGEVLFSLPLHLSHPPKDLLSFFMKKETEQNDNDETTTATERVKWGMRRVEAHETKERFALSITKRVPSKEEREAAQEWWSAVRKALLRHEVLWWEGTTASTSYSSTLPSTTSSSSMRCWLRPPVPLRTRSIKGEEEEQERHEEGEQSKDNGGEAGAGCSWYNVSLSGKEDGTVRVWDTRLTEQQKNLSTPIATTMMHEQDMSLSMCVTPPTMEKDSTCPLEREKPHAWWPACPEDIAPDEKKRKKKMEVLFFTPSCGGVPAMVEATQWEQRRQQEAQTRLHALYRKGKHTHESEGLNLPPRLFSFFSRLLHSPEGAPLACLPPHDFNAGVEKEWKKHTEALFRGSLSSSVFLSALLPWTPPSTAGPRTGATVSSWWDLLWFHRQILNDIDHHLSEVLTMWKHHTSSSSSTSMLSSESYSRLYTHTVALLWNVQLWTHPQWPAQGLPWNLRGKNTKEEEMMVEEEEGDSVSSWSTGELFSVSLHSNNDEEKRKEEGKPMPSCPPPPTYMDPVDLTTWSSTVSWTRAKDILLRMTHVIILLRHEEKAVRRARWEQKASTRSAFPPPTTTSGNGTLFIEREAKEKGEKKHEATTMFSTFSFSFSSSLASLRFFRLHWLGLALSWMTFLRETSPQVLDDVGFETLSRLAVEVYWYYHEGRSVKGKTENMDEEEDEEKRAERRRHQRKERRKRKRKERERKQGEEKTPKGEQEVEGNTCVPPSTPHSSTTSTTTTTTNASAFLTLKQYIEILRQAYLLSFHLTAEEMLATAAASACSLSPHRGPIPTSPSSSSVTTVQKRKVEDPSPQHKKEREIVGTVVQKSAEGPCGCPIGTQNELKYPLSFHSPPLPVLPPQENIVKVEPAIRKERETPKETIFTTAQEIVYPSHFMRFGQGRGRGRREARRGNPERNRRPSNTVPERK